MGIQNLRLRGYRRMYRPFGQSCLARACNESLEAAVVACGGGPPQLSADGRRVAPSALNDPNSLLLEYKDPEIFKRGLFLFVGALWYDVQYSILGSVSFIIR